MKKIIFTILTALSTIPMMANVADDKIPAYDMAGNGIGEIVIDMTGTPVTTMPYLAAAEDGDEVETLDFHYCGDPVSVLATGDAGDIENSAAILLPEDVVAQYAGAEIVAVRICSGANRENYLLNNITDATIFLNHDIFNEKDFYTQPARLSKSSQTWSETQLKTPYRLEAGKPVYVGYKVIRPTEYDLPFSADRIPVENDCSFWVNYSLDGKRGWENWAPLYGSVCMHVILRGNTLPVNNVEVVSMNVPMQVMQGPFNTSFRVRNLGVNAISSINYTCTVGEGTKVTKEYTFPTPLEFSEATDINLSLNCEEYGLEIPVTVTVTSVNGVDDTDPSNNMKSGSTTCLNETMGFQRRFVMEEGTGLWCSNCPRGLGTMEYMNKKYPDTFIGIGIHQGDPMQISYDLYPGHAYTEHTTLIGSYPNGRYNRDDATYGNSINDFGSHVEGIYKSITAMPAVADISAEIYFTDEEKTEINVETKTQFALDTTNPYRIALVLTENNVGPYVQSNGYAGAGMDCGGWESLPGQAVCKFNEVARYIDAHGGTYNSLPTDKKAKTQYAYNSLLPTAPLKSLDDFDVVAMIINGKTGLIENAVKCHGNSELPIKPSTSIGNVTASDAQARVEAVAGGLNIKGTYGTAKVYGFDGSVVAEVQGKQFIALPAGLYIVSVDGAANCKVQVK